MKSQVNFRIIILGILLVIVVDRTSLTCGQQEEKFFYHADFTDNPRNVEDTKQQQQQQQNLPVFPEGPLHVSLGLRALSGDNRPQYSEPIADRVHAQV